MGVAVVVVVVLVVKVAVMTEVLACWQQWELLWYGRYFFFLLLLFSVTHNDT